MRPLNDAGELVPLLALLAVAGLLYKAFGGLVSKEDVMLLFAGLMAANTLVFAVVALRYVILAHYGDPMPSPNAPVHPAHARAGCIFPARTQFARRASPLIPPPHTHTPLPLPVRPSWLRLVRWGV